MNPKTSSESPRRFGVVATDPLRILGLQAILSDEVTTELVPLTGEGTMNSSGLSLILLDAACTDHLFEMLAAFRNARAKAKIIVVGLEGDHKYIQQIIGAGAKGYLNHTSSDAEIRMAVEIVLDGSVWAPRKVMARLIEARNSEAMGTPLHFTNRELDVLRLLVAGRPNRDIAAVLGIDEATVKAHVGRLMRKVGVKNRIELTMETMRRNLLPH